MKKIKNEIKIKIKIKIKCLKIMHIT